jgi:hypothetical protein
MKRKKLIAWISLLVFLTLGFVIVMLRMNNPFIPIALLTGALVPLFYLFLFYSGSLKARKLVTRIFLGSIALLVILSLFAGYTNIIPSVVMTLLLAVLSITVFLSLLFIIVSRGWTDNTLLIFILLSLVGLVMKYFHIPGTGPLLVVCWSAPSILFMFIFATKITEYDPRTNKFLGFCKNFMALTLMFCFASVLFKTMHYPGAEILRYTSLPSLILSILGIVFMLPSSNFVEWTKKHKRMFYRAILIPLLYMAILNSLGYVFPETFTRLMYPSTFNISNGFNFENYQIPPKEGL